MKKDNNNKETEQCTLHNVSCSVCGSHEISHEEKEGRGNPPKGWVRKRGDRKKYSWRGIWDVYTCNNCGETWSRLRD